MKIPQEKIQKLAEYTYSMHRKANDPTPYADLSKADKQSYLNEAKEQIEYINDNLEIIGASPEEVDKLVHSLASTMEHSVMLMGENASLKQTIALREASLHDMKGKMQRMQENLDRVLVQSNDSSDRLESVIDESDALLKHVPPTPIPKHTPRQKNDSTRSKVSNDVIESAVVDHYQQLEQTSKPESPSYQTPATDSIDRAHILAVMSRYGFEKAKVAISKELGESKPAQMKASKANWIARYEKKYGLDVLIITSEVCDGAV